ncbi:hypothetical protein [Caballeronia sp. dw_276]|jgi:hypothetical protein|uniref:hypothetical protein n=1 Tax=Caballeronia sp. dw_276 TaxID=2719795 RepID=UPI00210620AE|nr:hypothetical protein [Caballeronia sp. dw_276]
MTARMTDAVATAFLKDVRHPLLALHRSLLDELRARHEAEFGAVSPAEFLQIVINGSAFKWLGPLSTLIAALDDVIDDPDATPDGRIDMAHAVASMFGAKDRNAAFDVHYLPMLQASPEIALANGRVAQQVRAVLPAEPDKD